MKKPAILIGAGLAIAILAAALGFVVGRMSHDDNQPRSAGAPPFCEVIAAYHDMHQGDTVEKADVALLRLPQALTTGNEIPVSEYHSLVGRKLARDVPARQPFRQTDLAAETE